MATTFNKSYKPNFERLSSLLNGTEGTIIGSLIDTVAGYIQPTIVTGLSKNGIVEYIDGASLTLYLMTKDLREMS
jgi:hypothetical protein